jgi:hypothetical protein
MAPTMSASAAHSPARPRAARRWSGPIRFRPTGDGRARRDDNADPQTSTGSDFRFEPGQFGWLLSVVRRLRSPSIRFSFSSSAACCGRWPIGKTPTGGALLRKGEWEGVAFPDELERLEDRLSLAVVHVLERPPADWQGEKGYVTAEGAIRAGQLTMSGPQTLQRGFGRWFTARTGGCERRRRNEDSRAADWPSDQQGVGAYGVKPSRSRRPD